MEKFIENFALTIAFFSRIALPDSLGSKINHDAKLGEAAKLIIALLKFPSTQIAWLLLYFCVVPKINHLLRTLPPASVLSIAEKHDARVLDVFRCLFGIPHEEAWDDKPHCVGLLYMDVPSQIAFTIWWLWVA